ncbi:MAG TPA: redoxin domain-containing protein [Acidimicrobiales bacterium]|nr:redoxin domain-containing protein [Acidimicrobiales bacterium]
MLAPGDKAPSFSLADAETGAAVSDPWLAGRTVLAFFKTTCPVCQMVAPKLTALARAGVRVVGVGEDPVPALQKYATRHGQDLPTLSEPPPFAVSSAYGVSSVPSLVVVGTDGIVEDAVASWDRSRWNQVAASFGLPAISDESDGLPHFRPG